MNGTFTTKDFATYSPENVIAENLEELIRRADILGELEIAHLRELAKEMAQREDVADLLSSLHDYRIASTDPSKNVLINNTDLILRSRKILEARQCMILCASLYQELRDRSPLLPLLFWDEHEIAPYTIGHIVYQRNSYADDAYLAFAKLVPGARATYAHNFQTACQEVFDGHCEFCILPIENAVEGELIGFAKLIAQYDLKIAAACDIAGVDASRKTRFALLRRNMLPFFTPAVEANEIFRFSLPSQSTYLMSDILSAASFFGLTFLCANTLPTDKEGASACFNLTFDIRNGDLYPFLLYLAMVAPQYTPIGIYSCITQKGM